MKKYLKSVQLLFNCLTLNIAWATTAWAQEEGAGGGDSKSYVLPYFVLILSIGLGVFLVCRPVNRADAERADYSGGPTPQGIRGEDFHGEGS